MLYERTRGAASLSEARNDIVRMCHDLGCEIDAMARFSRRSTISVFGIACRDHASTEKEKKGMRLIVY